MINNNSKIRFSVEASTELEAAMWWYEEQRRGLGQQFLLSLEASLDSIIRTPQLYPILYKDNIRRALLKRFPYGIIFREKEERIEVISIFHSSRDSKKIITRI